MPSDNDQVKPHSKEQDTDDQGMDTNNEAVQDVTLTEPQEEEEEVEEEKEVEDEEVEEEKEVEDEEEVEEEKEVEEEQEVVKEPVIEPKLHLASYHSLEEKKVLVQPPSMPIPPVEKVQPSLLVDGSDGERGLDPAEMIDGGVANKGLEEKPGEKKYFGPTAEFLGSHKGEKDSEVIPLTLGYNKVRGCILLIKISTLGKIVADK